MCYSIKIVNLAFCLNTTHLWAWSCTSFESYNVHVSSAKHHQLALCSHISTFM